MNSSDIPARTGSDGDVGAYQFYQHRGESYIIDAISEFVSVIKRTIVML